MLTDARHRAIVLQGALIAAVIGGAYVLVTATAANLSARGIPLGFGFLFAPANFSISETLLPFKPQDPNWWAIVVGIANTLFVSAVVIVASSILGCLSESDGSAATRWSPARRASGWRSPEHARHYPADLRLCVVVEGPAARARGGESAARRLPVPARPGAADDRCRMAARAGDHAHRLRGGCLGGTRPRGATAGGHRPQAGLCRRGCRCVHRGACRYGGPVRVSRDRGVAEAGQDQCHRGLQLTPELTTILVGLTLYTTGFIAEIVRGGILAIGKGQWEAARSLGLTQGSILRLVIVPQTLRVVLPPLTSQYVNVVKNSTLAIAVGYQDFMTIVGTIINKTSHAVEGIAIILGVFLTLNLLLSGALNWVNRRMAIVER